MSTFARIWCSYQPRPQVDLSDRRTDEEILADIAQWVEDGGVLLGGTISTTPVLPPLVVEAVE